MHVSAFDGLLFDGLYDSAKQKVEAALRAFGSSVLNCGMAGVFMGVFVLHRALCQLFRDVWQSCRDCNFYFMALWYGRFRSMVTVTNGHMRIIRMSIREIC